MSNVVKEATHFGSPLLVDDEVSESLFADAPWSFASRLTSRTLFEDYTINDKYCFDNGEAEPVATNATNWSRADTQSTTAQAQIRHGFGSGTAAGTINGGGLRLQAGAGTDNGINLVRSLSASVRGDAWVVDRDTSGGSASDLNNASPITYLTCIEFRNAAIENDIFAGLVKATSATSTTPLSLAGALNTAVQSVGFHAVADTDTVLTPRAVGNGGTVVTGTTVNGGVPLPVVRQDMWVGFRIDGNDKIRFFYGENPFNMRLVGFIDLPSTNNFDNSSSAALCPAYSWNQGDGADSTAYQIFIKKLLVHQPNVFIVRNSAP